MRSSLVYRYSCARCACEYVSSTTHMFHTRVCDHIGKSHRTGFPPASSKHSNVRLHAEECRVSVDGSNFMIHSGYERSQETLLNLESVYICKSKPCIIDIKRVHTLLKDH